MATPIEAGSPSPGPAPGLALTPDPLLAQLLERQARGEKLSPQEYGKLGAWRAKLKGLPLGRPRTGAPGPAQPGPGLAAAVAVAPGPGGPVAAGEAQLDLPGAPPVDPDLVRRTTEAILKTCDGIAQSMILGQAKAAGADESTARLFSQAAALPQGPRDLMVSTSPEVAAALGVDTRNYPIAAFLTGLGIWSSSLLLAVTKLQALQKENAARKKSAAPPPPAPAPAAPEKEKV